MTQLEILLGVLLAGVLTIGAVVVLVFAACCVLAADAHRMGRYW